jgi:hypothetical protein
MGVPRSWKAWLALKRIYSSAGSCMSPATSPKLIASTNQQLENDMRELTGHKVNPANDVLRVLVLDEPGSGGANHHYEIQIPTKAPNSTATTVPVHFQNGPIREAGVNGVTHETLLAILIDRMEGFQAGPYASADNQEALDAMRTAQTALQRRTKERMARGVEGTHEK